jgi:putative transposase
LKAEDIRSYTQQVIQKHVPLAVKAYHCNTEMIVDVLLKASAENCSIEAASADLEAVADCNTICEYLNAVLNVEKLREQEKAMNAALAESIPAAMQRTKVEVAIDFHDEPFYGKQEALRKVTCNGHAKKGTTHFVRIATAYVIWKQVRLTLAVRYVLPEEETLDIWKSLLQRLKALGIVSRALYLDKGFASGPVIRHLQAQHQPAIIACPIRGKDGGTRALCKARGSYTTPYTFTDGTQETLAMKASLVPDKTGQFRRKWLAFIIIEMDWSVDKVHDQYRRRFGVECSYRSLRRVRGTTTSRNPALRFFLLSVGLLLVNVWAFLRWEFARLIAPGPRWVNPSLFRFYRFTRFLIRAVEDRYGVLMSLATLHSPQSVIY